MEETDSTEVKYKIRQWSLPGATIVPVLKRIDGQLGPLTLLADSWFCPVRTW